MSVRFSTADLDLFSTASHDRNPLHMSADYARRSPFGQRVVHGVLGALAVLAHTPAPPGRRVEQITLEFQRPMFTDTDYEVSDGSLMDGSTTLLKTEVQFVPGKPASTEFVAGSARETAASFGELELVAGLELDGAYSPHPAAAALFERLKLDAHQWGGLPLAALLWSSYLAGMEIPGERALYFRFKIKFEPVAIGRGPLVWKARLKSRNALNLLRAEFELGIAGGARGGRGNRCVAASLADRRNKSIAGAIGGLGWEGRAGNRRQSWSRCSDHAGLGIAWSTRVGAVPVQPCCG
jgi:hypothetical protein